MCCVVFVYILVCVLCCVCKYFSLCFFVKKKKKKKKIALCDQTYPLRSNAYTGLHSNSLAFVRTQSHISHTHLCTHAIERTLYVRTQTQDCIRTHMRLFKCRAHFTHTLSTNAIERMYVHSIACDLSLHMTSF
jgi:hypothetical protein